MLNRGCQLNCVKFTHHHTKSTHMKHAKSFKIVIKTSQIQVQLAFFKVKRVY
jgi:hypothetical protein